MSIISVDIGRIYFTDLDLEPEMAERIKENVEVELLRLLEKEGLPDGLAGREISSLDVPAMELEGNKSDSYIAESLAQSIVRALQRIG